MMFDRHFEWYRIVNASPKPEVLANRKQSASALLQEMLAASDCGLLVAATAAVVTGLAHGFRQDSPLVQATIRLVKEHDASFPQDLSENRMELRACAAMALGELLGRSDDSDHRASLAVAASLLSALALKPDENSPFVAAMLAELHALASSTMERHALAQRVRPRIILNDLRTMQPSPDLTLVYKNVLPALVSAIEQLERQSRLDREELEMLWWLEAGFCKSMGKSCRQLSAGSLALGCARDIADIVVLPPSASVYKVLERMVSQSQKKTAQPQGLAAIVSSWAKDSLSSLCAALGDTQIVADCPCVFPMTWLSLRIRDSQVTEGWETEFALKTGLSAAAQRDVTQWANQAFQELVALKLCQAKR